MNKKFYLFFITCIALILPSYGKNTTQWTVIGAGPAGIAVTGLLLEAGISPEEIVWVDPEFDVGRLSNFESVPGNAPTKWYVQYLQTCKAFREVQSPALTHLYNSDQNAILELKAIIEPLRDITRHLRTKIHSIESYLISLDYKDEMWHVGLKNKTLLVSKNVIIATGCKPRTLNYPVEHQIPLDYALNKEALATMVSPHDIIAVIGSAHSAILVMKFLSELPVSRIINFYNKPLYYPILMGNWTFQAEAGLKGTAAVWAKNVLEKNPPKNLMRVFNSEESRKQWLPACNKIVYAVGFERNELPAINSDDCHAWDTYDDTTGKIGPRLFGVGIAFPQGKVDPLGNKEHKVGLRQFMEYIQEVMPEWLKQKNQCNFAAFNDLFNITLL